MSVSVALHELVVDALEQRGVALPAPDRQAHEDEQMLLARKFGSGIMDRSRGMR